MCDPRCKPTCAAQVKRFWPNVLRDSADRTKRPMGPSRSPARGHRERGVRGRVNGQQTAESTRVDESGDYGLAAHQAQFDAATETLFRFFGQNGECAARHEIKAGDIDDEGPGRDGDVSRLADQLAAGLLVRGIDLSARAVPIIARGLSAAA